MRTTTRRALRTFAAMGALALIATACGDGDGGTDTTTTDGGAAPSPGETGGGGGDLPDLSGQSIEVAAVWTGAEQEAFQVVMAEFEERTGADVTFTSTGDDINAFLQPRIEGGQPPDVAVLPQPAILQRLAGDDTIIALDDAVGDLVDQNYADVWRELATVDGTLYGVWFKAANKSTVWYNVNVFNDAGVETPEDWQAYQDALSTLVQFGVTPLSVGGADGWVLTDWFENVYLRSAGPDLYDQLASHEIPWTHESVVTAFETMNEVLGQRDFLVGGFDGALQTSFPESVTQVFSDPPGGAVVFEGDFVAGNIRNETNAELGTDADFFPWPTIDGSAPSVLGSGDVAVGFTDNDATKAFLRYLAMPIAAELWAEQGGFTSPNANVDLSVYPDDITRRIAEQLTSAEVFRFDLSDLQPSAFGGTVGQGLFKLFQDYLQSPDDFQDILQQMEDAASAAYEEESSG